MKKIKIFLDMDGVLADFDKGALTQFKIITANLNKNKELLLPEYKDEKSRMWATIRKNPHFWSKLELMPGAVELWNATCQYDPIILTAAPSSFKEGSEYFLDVARRKEEWIKEKFNVDTTDKFICTTSKKKQLFMHDAALHHNILIDDRESNINNWIAAGGIGILHKNIDDTLLELKEVLKIEFKLKP